MKYVGSKRRIAKYILPIILKDRKPDQWFVEPFCGGCNITSLVTGNRLANDNNYYLIEMWKAVSNDNWLPKHDYSEDFYNFIKSNKDYDKVLTGYFGFALSYGGMFFGGWRRDSLGKRNYVLEAYRSACKEFHLLKGVIFENFDYFSLKIPENSIIYCDPPYKNTYNYKASINFDYEKFYNWCRNIGKFHKLFISEYEMPDDFACIWAKEICSSLTLNTGGKKSIEKLFILK